MTREAPTGFLRPLHSRPVLASRPCLSPPTFTLSCFLQVGEKEGERETGREEAEGKQGRG